MKQSALAKRQAAFQFEVQTEAAKVFRVALADLTDAQPNESLKEAFGRAIDARVDARIAANANNRWYRRLRRWITRFPLDT